MYHVLISGVVQNWSCRILEYLLPGPQLVLKGNNNKKQPPSKTATNKTVTSKTATKPNRHQQSKGFLVMQEKSWKNEEHLTLIQDFSWINDRWLLGYPGKVL
jgi:hypothetical protein